MTLYLDKYTELKLCFLERYFKYPVLLEGVSGHAGGVHAGFLEREAGLVRNCVLRMSASKLLLVSLLCRQRWRRMSNNLLPEK